MGLIRRISPIGNGNTLLPLRLFAKGHAQPVQVALEFAQVEMVALLNVLVNRGSAHFKLRLLDFEPAALVVTLRELVAQDAQGVGQFLDGTRDSRAFLEQHGDRAFAFAHLPAQPLEVRFDPGVLRFHRGRTFAVRFDVELTLGNKFAQFGNARLHWLALMVE